MIYKLNLLNKIDIKLKITRTENLNGISIFNYHQIAAEFNKKYHSEWTFTTIDFFEQQMIWLKESYKVISLEQAIEMANENLIDDKYACITLDDGDKSIFDAMRILEKHEIPATFFINSGYLGNNSACWFHIYQYIKHSQKHSSLLTDDIEENIKFIRNTNDKILYNEYAQTLEQLFIPIKDEFRMFVSFEELKRINNTLFDIGLHGYEHQRFSMMDTAWQKNNILKDRDELSSLKAYTPIFAIPFGRPHDWNIDTIKICMELGLEIVFANGGTNYARDIGYKRIPADGRILRDLDVCQ